MTAPITVLKFGSSVLADRSRLPAAVHDVYREYRSGHRVVVVVSAIGRHTDLLLDEAQHIANPAVPETALARLLSTGEDQAAALLTIAAHRAGIQCQLLAPAEMGLLLHGGRLDADPYTLNRHAVLRALEQTPVVIMPGFSGVHERGGMALLGRGGSDLTAVFVAEQISAASCVLVKDVDGIYQCDPAEIPDDGTEQQPERYADITYEDALRVAGVLVQPKAVEYLQCTRRKASVTALLHERGTTVGAAISRHAHHTPRPATKVALLGLGTVGEGVYSHLRGLPNEFEVVAIAIRDPRKPRSDRVPKSLLQSSIDAVLSTDFDLLIDVSGDTAAAKAAIATALLNGRAVVTADKRLVAEEGPELTQLALQGGTLVRYAAAVGGSAPMLETLDRAITEGPIAAVHGVLNGTCNYILDRMADGVLIDDAIAEAQELGFAEADPERDLSGQDALHKLRILARHAFGRASDAHTITCEGIQCVTREQVQFARTQGQILRLVASFTADGAASVAPTNLARDDYLAGTSAHENRLSIVGVDQQEWRVRGQGAGRWPTAEAVIADAIEIRNSKKRVCPDLPSLALNSQRLPPLSGA